MVHGGKTCWKVIRVRGPEGAGREERLELHGSERLVALYRFQHGEGSADHGFTVGAPPPNHQAKRLGSAVGGGGRREVVLTDPGEVDWDKFPVVAALEAVTRDELSRLRSLLRADHLLDARSPGFRSQPRGGVASGDERTPVPGGPA
jgi:hypothetical protein